MMPPTLKEALEKLRTEWERSGDEKLLFMALREAVHEVLAAADQPVHPEEITYEGELWHRVDARHADVGFAYAKDSDLIAGSRFKDLVGSLDKDVREGYLFCSARNDSAIYRRGPKPVEPRVWTWETSRSRVHPLSANGPLEFQEIYADHRCPRFEVTVKEIIE